MPKDYDVDKSIVGDKGQYGGSKTEVLRKALAGQGRVDKPRTLGELGSAAGTDPEKLLKRAFGD